jgi:hypothetical protein
MEVLEVRLSGRDSLRHRAVAINRIAISDMALTGPLCRLPAFP